MPQIFGFEKSFSKIIVLKKINAKLKKVQDYFHPLWEKMKALLFQRGILVTSNSCPLTLMKVRLNIQKNLAKELSERRICYET